jgi:hypothetical protein
MSVHNLSPSAISGRDSCPVSRLASECPPRPCWISKGRYSDTRLVGHGYRYGKVGWETPLLFRQTVPKAFKAPASFHVPVLFLIFIHHQPRSFQENAQENAHTRNTGTYLRDSLLGAVRGWGGNSILLSCVNWLTTLIGTG